MNRLRASLGLCMLCVLAVSAFAAQTASAAGLKWITCVNTATVKDFATEHCVRGQTGTAYGHVDWTGLLTHAGTTNAKTNAATNGRTNWVFKETIAGTNIELESTEAVEGLGTASNEEVGGEWRGTAESDENGIVFNGVKVNAPAGKGCKVFADNGGVKGAEGLIKTKPVRGRTVLTGEVEEFQIEPVTPKVFATFFVECEKGVPEALQGTWEVTGDVKCPIHGTTITCEHTGTTTQNTLKGKGTKAGIAGKLTDTAGKFPVTEPTHGVGVTRVP